MRQALVLSKASLSLRSPQPFDYEAIASWVVDQQACIRWAGPAVPFPLVPATLPEILQVEGGASYCLAEGNQPCVGFGQCWTEVEGAVHIGRIMIAPEVRGQGVGRLLCEKLIHQVVESTGALRVTLRVYRDNARARALYSSLGFAVVESKSTDELLFMSACL
ncbi:hypothetical protein BFW38_04465 [Terasakiispira papahanaumokuakeensis]|uniref:N-acetyltransferase domain-containing protein n=1 Tax=Terasakiispira papahanaumokuakeensis TaxID=197479 RepID=A0A1E2V7C5_9GAMM|nr:GNAT family N-acetyltransferase [Terasakiispira papahanaumokuakeensis]ODC02918.1 hypothetical protein BFW38_04465 [Terasakiispira papahanaumokuakeensis]